MAADTISLGVPNRINLGNQEEIRNILSSVTDTMPSNAENSDQPADITTYSVECLLGKCVRKKVTHYLVKWKGYEEATWEPHTNIPMWIKRAYINEQKDNI